VDIQNQKQPKFKIVDESNRFLYARCPFHKDTNPSLCINRIPNKGKPKGYYFCFGCGAFGEITSQEVDELCKNININVVSVVKSDIDWDTLHLEYWTKEFFEDNKADKLAAKWNVHVFVINELGIGWDGHAHTIPMYDLDKIIGIQRQFTNGYKCMVNGSNLGLIVPMTMATGNVLFIPEGASDLACLLDMGYHGIARPNALVGKELVYNWLKRYNPVYDKIIIIGDNDDIGKQGAFELQKYIDSEYTRSIVRVPEKGKDLREWISQCGKEYVKNYFEDCIKVIK